MALNDYGVREGGRVEWLPEYLEALGEISQALEACKSCELEGSVEEALATVERLTSKLKYQLHDAVIRRQFFETITTSIADGVILADAEQHITLLNDAARDLLGQPANGEISVGKVDVRFPDGRPTGIEHMPLVKGLRGEVFVDYEIVIVRPDGTQRFLKTSGRPILASDGSIVGAIVVLHDVTSEREAMGQLEEQRGKLEQIVESLPEGVLIIESSDAVVTTMNLAARAIFGNLQVGRSLFKQKIPKMARGPEGPLMKIEEHPLIQTLRHGTPLTGRLIRVIHPDGRVVHILTDTVPLLDKTASVVGAVSVSRDISGIRAEHEKLQRNYEREHHLAEILQRSLLQGESLEVEGFQVAAAYRPALESERVGGDFYDSFKLPDGRAVVCIGDVSGKGVEAAVFTSLARDCIRAYMLDSPSPAIVLRRLNRTLLAYLPEEYFVTVFLAIINPETSKFVYASAGHDPPLIYRARARKVYEIPVAGRLAGIFSDLVYKQRNIKLYPGDILFLYTDGLADARRDGQVLGVDGLSQFLMQFIDSDPSRIIEQIYEGAREFAGGSLYDDAAAIMIKAINR